MKRFAILILSLFSMIANGQEMASEFDGQKWEAPYFLPIPKDWTPERFLIPISFAPQIPYKGIEDIRFSPGWAKIKSDEYWSYAFLWYLEGEVKVNSKIIARNLKVYYTGLIAINDKNTSGESIIPVVTSFKEVRKETGDLKTYIGKIKMLDYREQKPIVLNCKVHLQFCLDENRTCLFYELSPQPLSHNIWLRLEKLWSDFTCKMM